MTTLKNIIERINSETGNDNNGGHDSRTSESQAAEYAREAADEAGYGLSADNIEAHLNVLTEAGAIFDTDAALKIAQSTND